MSHLHQPSATTKHALHGLTDHLRMELSHMQSNVKVILKSSTDWSPSSTQPCLNHELEFMMNFFSSEHRAWISAHWDDSLDSSWKTSIGIKIQICGWWRYFDSLDSWNCFDSRTYCYTTLWIFNVITIGSPFYAF